MHVKVSQTMIAHKNLPMKVSRGHRSCQQSHDITCTQ